MALPAVLLGAMGRAAATGGGAARAVAQLGEVQTSISAVGAAAQQTTHFTAQLANMVTGKMAKALTLWIGWVKSAAAPIESLVRVANPAIAEAFGRAVADAYGVVGRMLIPVMNAFTGVARKVGDVMAGFEPVLQPVLNEFAKLVDMLGDEFVRYARESAPAIEAIATVLVRVADRGMMFVNVLGKVGEAFHNVLNPLLRLLGFTGGKFDPNASAVGSAARQARFVQPKEIADEAVRNALSMGVGRENEKTPEQHIKSIDETIGEFYAWAQRRFGEAAENVEAARTGAEQVRNTFVETSPAYRLGRYLAVRGRGM